MLIDDVGQQLRSTTLSVDRAIQLFADNQVVVYPVVEGVQTWQSVEENATGSTIFTDLHNAGATPEQMDQINAEIDRARLEGRTIDKAYEW